MDKHNFATGKVSRHILNIAGPMIVAQLINILYNVVDRIFIGRIPNEATQAMGGLGLCLPIITIIMAFGNLVGMGGSPLSTMARGRGDIEEGEKVIGNSFALLIVFAIALTIIGYLIKEPILWMFGASTNTFDYANSYLSIYLLGTVFVLVSLGMNGFMNGQGFPRQAMTSVLIGAVCNIILDPIFIFGLNMSVAGAALATVISQFLSALYTLRFFIYKAIGKLKREYISIDKHRSIKILSLGMSGFMMALTNSAVTIVCNYTLQSYGGDVYIAIMTVINSIREIASLPGQGIANAAQPVLAFNYGADRFDRVMKGIKFISVAALGLMTVVWLVITMFPTEFIQIFSHEEDIVVHGVEAIRLYFFGFFMMAFQMTGQSTAVGLGRAKQAVFFSIFRKIIIVVPLTIILPMYIGINGVFIAEAISNFIGGGVCYITMLLTIYRDLKRDVNSVAME